jgi:hypothetical protein
MGAKRGRKAKSPQGGKPVETASEAAEKKLTVRATFPVRQDIMDRARNAVVHLAGGHTRLTMRKLLEEGLDREIRRLEAEYNKGKPFPDYGVKALPGGRPIGT